MGYKESSSAFFFCRVSAWSPGAFFLNSFEIISCLQRWHFSKSLWLLFQGLQRRVFFGQTDEVRAASTLTATLRGSESDDGCLSSKVYLWKFVIKGTISSNWSLIHANGMSVWFALTNSELGSFWSWRLGEGLYPRFEMNAVWNGHLPFTQKQIRRILAFENYVYLYISFLWKIYCF